MFIVMFAGQAFSVAITPIFGLLYDIIGRFPIIMFGLFGISVLVILLPFTAPNFWLLVTVRVMISVLMRMLLVKPLLIDYLKNGSRGSGLML